MGKPPIDKGWAWFCVLGCHICTFFLVGGFKTLGILFVEFNEEFKASKAMAATMFGLLAASMSIFAPVAAALGEYYTERWVVMSGAALMFLGSFITSFATSMPMVIIGFGIFTGLGYACMGAPSLSLVGQYFNKRRSLATALAVAGGSLGQLLIPLFLRFLIDEFQWRGGLFIYSACILHVVVGAALLRPLSFYTRSKSYANTNHTHHEIDEPKYAWGEKHGPNHLHSFKVQSTPNIQLRVDDVGTVLFKDSNRINAIKYSNRNKAASLSHLNPNETNGCISHLSNDNRQSDLAFNYYSKVISSSTGSVMFSPISFTERTGRYESSDVEIPDSPIVRPSFLTLLKGSFCCCFIRKDDVVISLFDWSLFKKPTYVLIAFAMAVGNVGYINLFIMIPSHCKDIGVDRGKAAILISIIGVCDLFSRIFIGWFADLGCIKKNIIMGTSILIVSICTFTLPRLESFESMVAYSIIVGIFGGFYAALFIVLLIDIVGLKRIAKAFGMNIMILGLMNMPTPVVLGYLREVNGDWYMAYTMSGIFMLLSAICLFSLVFVNKLEKKMNNSEVNHSSISNNLKNNKN